MRGERAVTCEHSHKCSCSTAPQKGNEEVLVSGILEEGVNKVCIGPGRQVLPQRAEGRGAGGVGAGSQWGKEQTPWLTKGVGRAAREV